MVKKDKVEEMRFFQLLYNKSLQSIEAQNNSDLLFLLIVGQFFLFLFFFFFAQSGVAKVSQVTPLSWGFALGWNIQRGLSSSGFLSSVWFSIIHGLA